MSQANMGTFLVISGIVLMFVGAWVELRRQPVDARPAGSENPIVAVIKAMTALIGQFVELFKILERFTTGRFIMALGFMLVVLGVLLGLV